VTVYTSDWQDKHVVEDATHEDYNRLVEEYHGKDGAYAVRDRIRVNGTVEIIRLHEVAE